MSILHSIILGIVEGITEFLPISSTGHLILFSKILSIPDSSSLKSFEIIIQLGAILAVVVLYFKELFNLETIKKIIIAFIPTAIIGLIFYKIIKIYFLDNPIIVISSLFLGGIIMIIIEKWYMKRHSEIRPEFDKSLTKDQDNVLQIKDITYKKALFLGIWQGIAIIPGVSRSGATIIGGLLMKLKRETIVKFSFLLAVPTMFAATGLDLLKSYQTFSRADILNISIGFIVSFVFSLIFIKWLITYIQKHNFIIFGWYRIILAVIYFLVFYILL